MQIVPYILRRIGLAVFVLLGVTVITFFLSHSVGGNPIVSLLGRQAYLHPDLVAQLSAKYHFNDPLWTQFYYYVANLLQGNLGYSTSRGFLPVATVLSETVPYTVQIAFFAYIISLVLGISLGVLSALYRGKTVDRSIRTLYLAGISTPAFFVALLLLIIFPFYLHLLPNGGAVDANIPPPHAITGIPMLDSLIEGNFVYFTSAFEHVILPSLALAIGTYGIVVRILRSAMLDVMQSNFIRTARAKGLDESTVFFKHGLRNALISVVTILALMITWLITGTIFVENIFAYPGLGQYVFSALIAQDYPGILATTVLFGAVIVSANLAADLLYVVVDPQIRLG
ncbi:MAG: ABC transporter permease [Nitrososphaerales archaeon]